MVQYVIYLFAHCVIDYPYFMDQFPVTEPMYEEFCLLSSLAVHIVYVVCPVLLIDHIPVYLIYT